MSALLAKVLTALVGGAALMLVGFTFLELEVSSADGAYGLMFMGLLSFLVGAICLPQAQKSNRR